MVKHDGNIAPIDLSARTIKDRYPNVVIACLEVWWNIVQSNNRLNLLYVDQLTTLHFLDRNVNHF